MDWLVLISNLVRRIPIERVLLPPPDHTKALKEFADSVGAESQKEAPSEQKATTTTQTTEKPEIKPPQEASGVSPGQTVDYQKREIGKLLLRMERHCVQKFRIMGEVCDCGQSKHLLDLESLSEETVPMVDNPDIYYQIIAVGRELGPKCAVKVVASGLYDEEYPKYAHKYRDFRKDLIGTLDPSALFPQKPGELEGTQMLPVVSEKEKEEIKKRAIDKIEEVLG